MSKALIIDDETQMRRLLRMVLEGRGFAVCEAELGQQGLQEAALSSVVEEQAASSNAAPVSDQAQTIRSACP